MQTDIPLKRLTALCGADLLPLLGTPDAELLSVETLKLPATETSLDTVLHLRSPKGQEYLHVLEWQGYYDAVALRRLAHYITWVGQQNPTLVVVGSMVYLAKAYDVGNTLTQKIDDQVVLTWPMQAIRLWEQDAQAAVASGKVGLAVLSPLMRQASSDLVEQALGLVLTQTALPQQRELLSILGVFAEPLMPPQRFVQRVGKERLMESQLINYLMQEKTTELRAEFAAQQAKFAAQQAEFAAQQAGLIAKLQAELEAKYRAEAEAVAYRAEAEAAAMRAQLQTQAITQELRQGLQETLITRFPQVAPTVLLEVQRIMEPTLLSRLSVAALRAADLTEFEGMLRQLTAG